MVDFAGYKIHQYEGKNCDVDGSYLSFQRTGLGKIKEWNLNLRDTNG